VVELSDGIAPDRRGRGYAASAARLAGTWLLHDRHADPVELGIDPANIASQRAALTAGFIPAGTTRPAGTTPGDTSGNLRYVLRRHGRPAAGQPRPCRGGMPARLRGPTSKPSHPNKSGRSRATARTSDRNAVCRPLQIANGEIDSALG
jgi:hypothetical protein